MAVELAVQSSESRLGRVVTPERHGDVNRASGYEQAACERDAKSFHESSCEQGYAGKRRRRFATERWRSVCARLREMRDSRELPSGIVTFVFTDIEGSTQLLHHPGEKYITLLADQSRILREVSTKSHGREVETKGDVFFVSLARATQQMNSTVQTDVT